MGEENEPTSPPVWLGNASKPLDCTEIGYGDVVEAIGLHYEIVELNSLYDLAEQLVELAVVDQPSLSDHPGDKRRIAREIIVNLKSEAEAMIASAQRITAMSSRFWDEIGLAPPIWRQVFASDKERSIVDEFADGRWERSIQKRLSRLMSLELKQSVRSRMPNLPLQDAVILCKQFWTEAEGRPWQMFKLKDAQVRQNNCIGDLKNSCEQFVANMLASCGLEFNLTQLNSAWMAVAQQG